MNRYNVIGIAKTSGGRVILLPNVSLAEAEKFCEEWGWVYDDGQNSFWLDYEEE